MRSRISLPNCRVASKVRELENHGSKQGDKAMNLKTIVVDGYQVQVEDNAAAVIQRTI
jgi:hypothetical protein